MNKRAFCIILSFILLCSFASAHPGKTDGNGGHTNHSTGEYHYHHGYEAHQHINGTCPFSFKDKTDHSPPSLSDPSTSPPKSYSTSPSSPSASQSPSTQTSETSIPYVLKLLIAVALYVVPIASACFVCVLLFCIWVYARDYFKRKKNGESFRFRCLFH